MCFFEFAHLPRFMQKYADFDLVSIGDNTVPPIDLNAIGIVRSCLFKFQREVGKSSVCDWFISFFLSHSRRMKRKNLRWRGD